jgi:hypothetical protein
MTAPPCGEEADGFPPASVRAGDEAAQSRPLGRHKVRAREKNAAGPAWCKTRLNSPAFQLNGGLAILAWGSVGLAAQQSIIWSKSERAPVS